MASKPKRPFSVWVAMTFILLIGAALLFPLFYGLARIVLYDSGEFYAWEIIRRSALMVPWGAGCLVAVWAIATRRSWGRWIGLSSLVLMAIVTYAYNILVLDNTAWQTIDAGVFMGYLFGFFLYYLVPIFLIGCCLTLGKRVNAYFNSSSAASSEPPPPPVFES